MIFLVNRSNGVAIYRAKYCTERFGRRSKIGRISEVHHVGSGELRTTKGSQTVLLNWEKQMSFVPFTPVHYITLKKIVMKEEVVILFRKKPQKNGYF